jgi:hypothetical protein
MYETIVSITQIVRSAVRALGIAIRPVPWYAPLLILALFVVVS